MKTNFANAASPESRRLAELEKKRAALERELYDARESVARSARAYDPAPGLWDAGPGNWEPAESHSKAPASHWDDESSRWNVPPGHSHAPPRRWDAAPTHDDTARGHRDAGRGHDPEPAGPPQAVPDPADTGYDDDGSAALAVPPGQVDSYRGSPAVEDDLSSSEQRTAILINHGRASASRKRVAPIMKVAGTTAVVLAAVVGLVVLMLPGPGPAWPSGVAKVQAEITKACLNPDVSSEPGQVNFACGRSTRQILWIFALLTSHNNPNYAQAKTGRVGLEPISPTQGGVVAWSLNLHHPYDPTNPIDSIEVAARAINNIIGGATVTSSLGNPVIQAGLESHAANCLRYTGSAKVTSHKGYPDLCAQPVSSAAGQAALLTDVYQRWVVGASPRAAQNAATLFENAKNPSSPQVQAILKALPNANR